MTVYLEELAYLAILEPRFQHLLRLIRNLCLLERRMTPSLYAIALAAKGFDVADPPLHRGLVRVRGVRGL